MTGSCLRGRIFEAKQAEGSLTHSGFREDGLPSRQGAHMLGLQRTLVGGHAAVKGLAICLLRCICSPPTLSLCHALHTNTKGCATLGVFS